MLNATKNSTLNTFLSPSSHMATRSTPACIIMKNVENVECNEESHIDNFLSPSSYMATRSKPKNFARCVDVIECNRGIEYNKELLLVSIQPHGHEVNACRFFDTLKMWAATDSMHVLQAFLSPSSHMATRSTPAHFARCRC